MSITRSRRISIQVPTPPRNRSGFESGGSSLTSVLPAEGFSLHPWEQAHAALDGLRLTGFESSDARPTFAEPDFEQSWPFPRADSGGFESFSGSRCQDRDPDGYWPIATPRLGWHLDDEHSQLQSALATVIDPGPGRRVRAAILDTGYDPNHRSLPKHLLTGLGKNFADDNLDDATDPGRYFPGNQPGHGTATLALLAGSPMTLPEGAAVGGNPYAEVIPIRIADSVVHFYSSSIAKGIEYAIETHCKVISISMGGLPAKSWAIAVNRAYDAGVAIFAAAGNRFGKSPPTSIVWPARFNRVTAVCGVTADGTPYYREGLHRHMQGCFGPRGKMKTAIAASTPNLPWAVMGCPEVVAFGGGTSSATPQVAAAATLWLSHVPEPASIQPWHRVEAVRTALFASADKRHEQHRQYFGNGELRAAAALQQGFTVASQPTPEDSVPFPWLRPLDLFESATEGREEMYELESLHAYLQNPSLQEIIPDADPLEDRLSASDRQRFLKALAEVPTISDRLRERLEELK